MKKLIIKKKHTTKKKKKKKSCLDLHTSCKLFETETLVYSHLGAIPKLTGVLSILGVVFFQVSRNNMGKGGVSGGSEQSVCSSPKGNKCSGRVFRHSTPYRESG